MNLVWFGMRNR